MKSDDSNHLAGVEELISKRQYANTQNENEAFSFGSRIIKIISIILHHQFILLLFKNKKRTVYSVYQSKKKCNLPLKAQNKGRSI